MNARSSPLPFAVTTTVAGLVRASVPSSPTMEAGCFPAIIQGRMVTETLTVSVDPPREVITEIVVSPDTEEEKPGLAAIWKS